MSEVPEVSDETQQSVQFCDIGLQKYFRMQPEGFLMQKVSVIHFLPVSAGCKYRAFLLGQNERVYRAEKGFAR